MSVKNSLTTFLEQAMILETNSLETISKINDAVVSESDNVTLTLTDPNDPEKTKTYQIPSFGYLKKAIDRLDRTIKTLTNVDSTSNSKVRLSDGSYRKIIAASIPSEAPTIERVDNVTNFNFKSNWFFEDMLNPCLYVSWNMSDEISADVERVIVQRFLLTCDTQVKIDAFNDLMNGKNDITHSDFINFIVKYGIKYTLDEDIRNLPPRHKRYSGNFTVMKSELPKPNYYGDTSKQLKLDRLEYSDMNTSMSNTRILAVGDFLEVVERDSEGKQKPITTRYKVSYVDASDNTVVLELFEGHSGLSVGTTLKISSTQDTDVNIEIPVGFDEREVVFFKPIDPNSNIPAAKWSPGTAFYTNNLTYTDRKGKTTTLQKFYQQHVVDFGQVILSYAKDYYPSLREGITPDAPTLYKANFKVVKINNQLSESIDEDSFRALIANKSQISSEIDNLGRQIEDQKNYIQTTSFITNGDKEKAYNTLQNLVAKQNSLATNYNTTVATIKARTADVNFYSPKYRVRGFWEIPSAKQSTSSGPQQVVKFKIRYRYLSKNGNAPEEKKFAFVKTDNSTLEAVFSNWIEVEGKTRKRVKSPAGDFVWESVNIDAAETIKINQLDIPINPGEQLEIQVKSVSEAGWPSNPLESDWSESVTIAFSEFPELMADDVNELIEQNRMDAAVAGLSNFTKSTSEHMATSFYTNDKYFAHSAETITSGFLTPEQTPITLYDKLQDLNRQIAELVEKIDRVQANLVVTLIDENNKIYNLKEGDTTYIYAGDYMSELKELTKDEKNGAIITKTFQLDIKTDSESGLALLSKLVGNRLSMCPSTRKYNYVEKQYLIDDEGSESDGSDGNNDVNTQNINGNLIMPLAILNNPSKPTNQLEIWQYDDFLDGGGGHSGGSGSGSGSSGSGSGSGSGNSQDPNLSGDDTIIDRPTKSLTYKCLTCGNVFTTMGLPLCTKCGNKDGSKFEVMNPFTPSDKWDDVLEENDVDVPTNSQPTVDNGGIGTVKPDLEIESSIFDLCNRYELYDNVISPKGVASSYYSQYGRYDLVPINLSNSDVIDYQIASPNMYQSAQCCGQFVYSRFTNIGGTMNLYGNRVDSAGYGAYSDLAAFALSEKVYGTDILAPIWEEIYRGIKQPNNLSNAIKDLEKLLGDTIDEKFKPTNGKDVPEDDILIFCKYASYVMNRLPKTYESRNSMNNTLFSDKKVLTRLNQYRGENTNSKYAELFSKRLQQFNSTSTVSYSIKPKVQNAYGFGAIDYSQISPDVTAENHLINNVFLTTHKIGYEDKDRYAVGANTCDSFLFLSPINHKSIQVNGDNNAASVSVSKSVSIKVPIIYQYRMTDYNGYIFGDALLKDYDNDVKNAKYANIIGIDIWADVLNDRPKQYDIVVYSTYAGQSNTDTGAIKTSTQQIVDALTNITVNGQSLVDRSQSTTKI